MSTWMSVTESPMYEHIADMIPPPEPPRNPPSVKRTQSVQFSQEAVEARRSRRRASLKDQESARTMSQRYMREPVMDSTKLVWVEDELKIWAHCTILEQDNTVLKVQDVESGENYVIDTGFKDVHTANDKVVPDMSALHFLHEPGLLYNIRQRFHSQHPYTFMGLILIAVNPLQWYDQPSLESFVDRSLSPDKPHPYAIAELCYQELFLNNSVDQSVVISGESGSGKTETAKMVLSYLVSRLDGAATATAEASTNIDTRLIQSSPVLEAFGNSCTLRNPNSSRFGKFMKINISKNTHTGDFQRHATNTGHIVGATVETYLLEKSRVISQSPGEQNFHIFYQLLAGSSDVLSGQCVGRTSDFRILNDVVCGDEQSMAEHFHATRFALETVGYDASLQQQMWGTLSGILHLGNVNFVEIDSAEGGIASVVKNGSLDKAAASFGISPGQLVDLLTQKVMRARGEEFTISLTVNDACFARDAVCKATYDALFMDIVRSVNSSLRTSGRLLSDAQSAYAQLKYIGVLDIFGFESFAVNRFDQLLINYANESLQNTFNMQVFQSELNLLKEECIECVLDPSLCPDNSGCVDTIWISSAQIRSGDCSILTTLDAISKQPKPLDDKFCFQLHNDIGKVAKKQKYFPPPHLKDKRNSFLVKHFAGVVKYTVSSDDDSWVAKNNDTSPDTLSNVLDQSCHALVRRLLAVEASTVDSPTNKPRAAVSKSTIASTFARSMSALNAELHSTRCVFVRCIKPNSAMAPGVFDNAYVVDQVRALGLVQACEVMRVGLPNRMSYTDLKTALAPIVSEVEMLCAEESEEVLVASLLLACEVDDDSYRLGKTRVFFKPGKLAELEAAIQRAASSECKLEMLQRLRNLLSSRRELQEVVELTREKLAGVERDVSSGWIELESLQKIVTGQPDDGSATFSIVCSEANSAVDCLGAVIDVSVLKVNEVRALTGVVEGNEGYESVISMLEDIDRDISTVESSYRTIKMKHSSLSTQSRGKKSELHEAALDRWQDMSRVDDMLRTMRSHVKNMEAAATKFQANIVKQAQDEVNGLIQLIRTGLLSTLQLVHDNMSQIGNASTELSRLTGIANALIIEANDQTALCESIGAACVALRKEFENLQLALSTHEEERLQREREQQQRADTDRRQHEEQVYQREATAKATANRRGSVKALNVAALRKNIANMSVDRAATKTVTSISMDTVPAAPDVPPPPQGQWVLPEGWEEFFDSTNQLPYYFNTLTQETQWERPDAPAQSIGGQIHVVDDTHLAVTETVSSTSAANTTSGNMAHSVSESEYTSARGRSGSLVHPPAAKCNLTYGRITTAQLDILGVQMKKGILMKKSTGGLSVNRFKKKYFVLEGSSLTYYEKAEQYLCGSGGGKEMRLSVASSTSYTDAEATFLIKSPQLAHEKDLVWTLVAENTAAMHEWVAYINAHIHAIHMRLHDNETDVDEYWGMGVVQTSFWQLPVRNEYGPITNPVGIRTVPDADGPRTGEGVFPGEVVEVVQIIDMKENTYLRLADDRGWVFRTHPTKFSSLLNPLSESDYCYIEKNMTYKVDPSTKRGVPIQFSPGEGSPTTGKSLRNNEEVECTATWSCNDDEGRGCNLSTFVKLRDGRGWVMSVDCSGTAVLEQVIANPLVRK